MNWLTITSKQFYKEFNKYAHKKRPFRPELENLQSYGGDLEEEAKNLIQRGEQTNIRLVFLRHKRDIRET